MMNIFIGRNKKRRLVISFTKRMYYNSKMQILLYDMCNRKFKPLKTIYESESDP